MVTNTILYSSDYTSPDFGSLGFWLLLLTSLIFLIAGGLLMWRYFSLKNGQSTYAKKFEHKSEGSFKGYWGRNRLLIIAFFAGFFIIFGAFFFLFAFNIIGNFANNDLL